MRNEQVHIEEQKLLQQLAEGDEQAFATLCQHYRVDCYTTAFRILHQEQLAEDIVQDIFIKLWERRIDFYLSYCLHTLLTQIRKKKTTIQLL